MIRVRGLGLRSNLERSIFLEKQEVTLHPKPLGLQCLVLLMCRGLRRVSGVSGFRASGPWGFRGLEY